MTEVPTITLNDGNKMPQVFLEFQIMIRQDKQ